MSYEDHGSDELEEFIRQDGRVHELGDDCFVRADGGGHDFVFHYEGGVFLYEECPAFGFQSVCISKELLSGHVIGHVGDLWRSLRCSIIPESPRALIALELVVYSIPAHSRCKEIGMCDLTEVEMRT